MGVVGVSIPGFVIPFVGRYFGMVGYLDLQDVFLVSSPCFDTFTFMGNRSNAFKPESMRLRGKTARYPTKKRPTEQKAS